MSTHTYLCVGETLVRPASGFKPTHARFESREETELTPFTRARKNFRPPVHLIFCSAHMHRPHDFARGTDGRLRAIK